jgi:hypothetical protein
MEQTVTCIGSKALLEMQNGDPRKLIRGSRAPIFVPWKTKGRTQGSMVVITTASDLSVWHPSDIKMLKSMEHALVRLQRPGTLTSAELMALSDDPEFYWLDVFATAPDAQGQLLETWLNLVSPINNFAM